MSIEHCIDKIIGIVAEGRDDRRSLLQLGYNLGRLGELAGIGRESTWDAWKGPVADWDLPTLRHLARELQRNLTNIPHSAQSQSDRHREANSNPTPDFDDPSDGVLECRG